MTDVRQRLWQWYLAASVAGACAYFLLPRAGLAQAIVYTALTLACAMALLAGIRLYRPRHPAPWYVLALGMLVYAAADVLWFAQPRFPSVDDALFMSAYALLAGGFVMLARVRASGGYREAMIDALVIAGGVSALAWVFLMQPYVHLSGLTTLARAVAMAYPALDLLLLAAVTSLLLTPGRRRVAVGLLALGVVGQLSSDVNYARSLLSGEFRFGAPYFAGWFAAFAFIGAAALHPSRAGLSQPETHGGAGAQRGRLLVLAGAAMIAPLTLVLKAVSGRVETETIAFVAGLAAMLFALVLARVSGLMRDLTEYRRLQALKDEFVSIVSHELRTPLTSIRGSLGLLAGGVLASSPAKAERMLQIALHNTDRLVRLINDILDIERMESGKVELECELCDAEDLVRQAAETMRTGAREAGVRLDVSAARAMLRADPDRVLQTLTNLLSNAIKFSPENGTVWLGCGPEDGQVLFRVRDEGRGVPADKLETIFERFQQVDSSDAREKGGTGLGLAICRSIVEQHGGRIWAESVEGLGSAFQFTLPAIDVPRPAQPAEPEPAIAKTRPRVLVCDDDAGVREVVSTMLERRGYRTIAAASGREALDRAAAERPDAILLDLLMPGLSGWETAVELSGRPETRDIPVVILSVLSPNEAMPAPVTIADWISKPLDEQTLFGALERALTAQRQISRVLIVEDDPDLTAVLVALFERHGVQTAHAATGAEAIELSRDLHPHLLILDIGLPDGDGFWVAEWLRQHETLRSIPIVVYTGRDLDAGDRARLDTGHTRFMTKGAVTVEQFERDVLKLIGALAPMATEVGHAR